MRLILTILLIGLFKADAQMVINASAPYRPIGGFSGLLDNYPNAEAAYSLRKLDKDYTGSAIRIRKDTTGQPEQDIGFTAAGDLDTASLKSFLNARNGFVVTWYDQSGNARNATQSTQANQPRIANLGVIERRSSDLAIRFDGSNDRLVNATTGFAINNISHYCISSREVSSVSSKPIYGTGFFSGNYNGFGFGYFGSGNNNVLVQQIRNVSVTNIAIGNYTNTIDVNTLIFGISTSSIDYVYLNGGDEKTQTHTRANVNSTSNIHIGFVDNPPSFLQGSITEIVFWQSNQSSNRSGIETNINTYYSIY